MSRVEPNRNVYVGHRYVPKIFGEWDKKNEYEGLSIVTHQGNSYTSKKRVPVGIDINNDEYWVVTGNYNAQIEEYRKETERVSEDLKTKASKEEMDNFKKATNQDIKDFKVDTNTIINDYKEVTNNKINKIDDRLQSVPLSVKDFGAVGDGVTDDTNAIQRAFDESSIVFVPSGKYKLTKTINIPDNTQIIGEFNNGATRSQPLKSEFIINGFNCFETKPYNTPADKVNINVKNISITGTGKETGIYGGFGTELHDNNFTNLKIGINNRAGYSSSYTGNVFYKCDTGLINKQSYSVSIVNNHFSHVRIGVDTGLGSVATFIGNNIFNLSPEAEIMIVCQDTIQIQNNYFESFGDSPLDSYCIDYTFNRFALPVLTITDNHMRGSRALNHLIKIGADRNDGNINRMKGEITRNQMYQTLDSPIVYKENNYVQGLNIHNNAHSHELVLTGIPLKPYYNGTISTAYTGNENDFQMLSVSNVTQNKGVNVGDDNNFIAPVDGLYEISYTLGMSSVHELNSEINTIELSINGVQTLHRSRMTLSYKVMDNIHYNNVSGTVIVKLFRTNKIGLMVKGKSAVRDGSISVKLIENEEYIYPN